jgi:hypothetical protein
MKKLLLLLAVVLMASPAAAQLVITGVFDGDLSGGVPKGVELFACDDIADLSVYGLGSANNGGGSDGVEHFFPADFIAAGTTIYVAHVDSGNPTAFFDWFGFDFDYQGDGYSMAINGDDAIELFYVGADQLGTTVVDVFGDIDVDGNGTPWEYMDSWAKRNVLTGPDGNIFVLSSWSFGGVSAWDGALTNESSNAVMEMGGFVCDAAVDTESENWDSLKSMYR